MGLQDFRVTDQGSMLRVKGAATMLPIGPRIVRDANLFEQTLRTCVNAAWCRGAHR
jgi:5-oxopent-3-ene-1,2,5-tricarboxylate decarboxylase / 2-hydroxyhepta-2,4-diene-1,7-dioate isomerase